MATPICLCINRPGGRCKAFDTNSSSITCPTMQQIDADEADEEARIMGLEDYEVHAYPDGPRPDGKTWSFALGEWQDEDYLRSAKKPKKDEAELASRT